MACDWYGWSNEIWNRIGLNREDFDAWCQTGNETDDLGALFLGNAIDECGIYLNLWALAGLPALSPHRKFSIFTAWEESSWKFLRIYPSCVR